MNTQKLFNVGYDPALIDFLSRETSLDKTVVELLVGRGVDTKEKIINFINPSIDSLHNPFGLKGMKECVDRINQAVSNKERVLIFGDYDVDGISATAIMIKLFKALGIKANYYLPNRFIDGYGFTNESIKKVYDKYKPDLIISVDCGISCHDEVEYAKSLGIEMIITDHHDLPDVLPDCITINPKIDGQDYPFKYLCGAGVAFKVAQAILGLENCNELLTICCIATITDIVPLVDENRALVVLGMSKMNDFLPVGLKQMFKTTKISLLKPNATDISFKISPKLNASGRMGEASDSLVLYLEENPTRIKQQIEIIGKHNTNRQELCNNVFSDCQEILSHKNLSKEKCIILSSEKWDSGILGIIAARLVDLYNRPVFLFSQIAGQLKGSGRSVDEINIHDMLVSSSDLLETFGGHSMAAGLTLKVEHFDEFIARVNSFINDKIDDRIFAPVCYYDIEIDANMLTEKLCEDLEKLEPFGCSNPKPLFKTKLKNFSIQPLKNFPNHANIVIDKSLSLIYFNYVDSENELLYSSDLEVVFELQQSESKKSKKGVVKEILSEIPVKSSTKDICFSYYLNQLKYSNEKNTATYNYYQPNKLIEFVFDSQKTLYGTLFIANTLSTYHNFVSTYDLSNISNNYIFEIKKSGGNNSIVLAPVSLKNFNNFSKIVFLDPPLDSSYLGEINSVSDASIYIPTSKNFPSTIYSSISTDREKMGKIFNAIKLIEGKKFTSYINCYKNALRLSKQNFSFQAFYFSLLVFGQLDVLSVNEDKDGICIYSTKNHSQLTNSSIYNFINFLKMSQKGGKK